MIGIIIDVVGYTGAAIAITIGIVSFFVERHPRGRRLRRIGNNYGFETKQF